MGNRIEEGAKELARNFGRLVATHRRRLGWSQERLAAEAEISEAMIAKIETGASGARFPMIVRLAQTLRVDPVELFYAEVPKGKLLKGPRRDLVELINELDDGQISWINDLLKVALRPYSTAEKASKTKRNPAPSLSGQIDLRRRRGKSV